MTWNSGDILGQDTQSLEGPQGQIVKEICVSGRLNSWTPTLSFQHLLPPGIWQSPWIPKVTSPSITHRSKTKSGHNPVRIYICKSTELVCRPQTNPCCKNGAASCLLWAVPGTMRDIGEMTMKTTPKLLSWRTYMFCIQWMRVAKLILSLTICILEKNKKRKETWALGTEGEAWSWHFDIERVESPLSRLWEGRGWDWGKAVEWNNSKWMSWPPCNIPYHSRMTASSSTQAPWDILLQSCPDTVPFSF